MKGPAMHMALKATHVNGHSAHVSGRGIRRRRLSQKQRVRLAADLASGAVRLDPSIGQVCDLLRIPPAALRTELKARTVKSKVAALVVAWDAASEMERAEAISEIGPAEIWDRLAEVVS
jgi:hypothetical protein